MKQIRRKLISEIAGSPLKQKAVAFALLLKERTNNSSVVRRFSVYKVQKLTSTQDKKNKGKVSMMAYKTVKKYLDVLLKMEIAEVREGDLYIKKLASSSKHRNICIEKIVVDKTKNIYNQLRDVLFLVIQARKDFINSLLRLRKNPGRDTDFKKVRRLSKKCCSNPFAKYEEWGLSYNRIARFLGCSTRTAFTVVSDSIQRKWCTKENHCEMHRMDGVCFRDVPGYAFTTMNYGFILRPNTYALSCGWTRALGADAQDRVRKVSRTPARNGW